MLHYIGKVAKIVETMSDIRYNIHREKETTLVNKIKKVKSLERQPSTLRMEGVQPHLVLKSYQSKKASSELTGTGVHPIQAWKEILGVHDFWAYQKVGRTQASPFQEPGLASVVRDKNNSLVHSSGLSTTRGIQAGGLIKALAIGITITVWGGIVLDPIISPPTMVFDPSFLLYDIPCPPIQESVTSISNYDTLSPSSSYESCYDIGIEEGCHQLFDPLSILPQEKTESADKKLVLNDIGPALGDKRYSYALKLLAGALLLTLVLTVSNK